MADPTTLIEAVRTTAVALLDCPIYLLEAPEDVVPAIMLHPYEGVNHDDLPLEDCKIQVKIRHNTYSLCDALAWSVYNVLLDNFPVVAGRKVLAVFSHQCPYFLEKDSDGNFVFVVNLVFSTTWKGCDD